MARPGGLAWGGMVAGVGQNVEAEEGQGERLSQESQFPPLTRPNSAKQSSAPSAGASAGAFHGTSRARFDEASAQNARAATRAFRAALPTGRHLFFLDQVRPTEHYFRVVFKLQGGNSSGTGSSGTAYFAFHGESRRLRRAVNLDRDALSHSCFQNEGEETSVDVPAWRSRLEDHLKSKHYPEVSSVAFL